MFKRKRHTSNKMPELNTTSTADISFMLLIFFLVVSSMDSDKGLTRQLPSMSKNKNTVITDIEAKNVLSITIDGNNTVRIDSMEVNNDEQLTRRIVSFVSTSSHNNHLLALNVSEKANYDTYFHVQNVIANAYRQLRNDMARKKLGKPFSKCSRKEQQAITDYYPWRIAEGVQP